MSYSIIGDDSAPSVFNISSVTGEIQLTRSILLETATTYKVIVVMGVTEVKVYFYSIIFGVCLMFRNNKKSSQSPRKGFVSNYGYFENCDNFKDMT